VVPVGESGRLAEVQVERAKMLPLMMGEKVWSNRDQAIGRVPARFKGYRFTQFSVHSKTIKFKVKSNGLVNLCVPAHWWKPPAEQFPGPDHRTEAQLVGEGWIRHAGDEFFVGEDKWWVFSRQCQAGEQFSISTDRLESPILIFK
jgi:hypothetical protein